MSSLKWKQIKEGMVVYYLSGHVPGQINIVKGVIDERPTLRRGGFGLATSMIIPGGGNYNATIKHVPHGKRFDFNEPSNIYFASLKKAQAFANSRLAILDCAINRFRKNILEKHQGENYGLAEVAKKYNIDGNVISKLAFERFKIESDESRQALYESRQAAKEIHAAQ